ncbi:MAG: HAMP domain-containing histidine kinase [Bacteroidaceae bacterium]|nr:HAMP domain-containing histidine kinase [Bacteroidaceae bacterium]
MIVSVSGLTATLCSAFSSIAPSSLDPLASSPLGLSLAGIVCLIVCVWAIIRLWHLVRLPLHQTTFFVGAMENRDTTARLPRSDDPMLGPVLRDMNRVLQSYCLDRAGMESQRQYYDRILRVMAHELRNSVTPIISLTDWMQTTSISEEERAESLSIIHQQAEGIRSFLEHYQELTQLPDPQWADIPVRMLLEGLRLTLNCEPMAHRISYYVQGEPTLHADEKLVRLALLNIIRNAMQAIDGLEDGHISLHASKLSEEIRIVVSNNGPLIASSETEQIFQPFYSTKKEGTGIGLALSRRIMELHGGTLTCDSNPPLTMFTFTFPA